jgi:hypothetical protein
MCVCCKYSSPLGLFSVVLPYSRWWLYLQLDMCVLWQWTAIQKTRLTERTKKGLGYDVCWMDTSAWGGDTNVRVPAFGIATLIYALGAIWATVAERRFRPGGHLPAASRDCQVVRKGPSTLPVQVRFVQKWDVVSVSVHRTVSVCVRRYRWGRHIYLW